jgi:hypothetical protein
MGIPNLIGSAGGATTVENSGFRVPELWLAVFGGVCAKQHGPKRTIATVNDLIHFIPIPSNSSHATTNFSLSYGIIAFDRRVDSYQSF